LIISIGRRELMAAFGSVRCLSCGSFIAGLFLVLASGAASSASAARVLNVGKASSNASAIIPVNVGDKLKRCFMDLKLLKEAPDMSKLYSEAFLPK
jgi:hypothetical protein